MHMGSQVVKTGCGLEGHLCRSQCEKQGIGESLVNPCWETGTVACSIAAAQGVVSNRVSRELANHQKAAGIAGGRGDGQGAGAAELAQGRGEAGDAQAAGAQQQPAVV